MDPKSVLLLNCPPAVAAAGVAGEEVWQEALLGRVVEQHESREQQRGQLGRAIRCVVYQFAKKCSCLLAHRLRETEKYGQ